MARRTARPTPDLTGSTLVPAGDCLYVDTVTGMVLSRVGWENTHGYEYVFVPDRGGTGAHRVVWEAMHGPIPAGLTINHVDGVKTNNRPDNLELATPSEQIAHAWRTGLRTEPRRPPRRTSRLTADQVQQVRDAQRGGITALAASLGITAHHAYDIRAGRRLASPQDRTP